MRLFEKSLEHLRSPIFFSLLAALLFMGQPRLSAQDYQVVRGERPSIDYSNIPEDAYKKGVFRIKIEENYAEKLPEKGFTKADDGHVRFHIQALDALNKAFDIKEASRTFDVRALDNAYKARHEAWGFHLWFDLYSDKDADIIAMVESYRSMKEISVAELHFKKELIAFDHDDMPHPLNREEDSIPALIPDDERFEDHWHYRNTGQTGGTPGADIQLPEAWAIETGNEDIIVAVIDGGINPEHIDLEANIWDGVGYNFVDDTPNVNPTTHGTHVAGTIAAMNNNDLGINGIAGGWGDEGGVKVMSCQVFESGSFAPSGGFEIAPVWAADQGAHISQNSWGYTSPNYYEEIVLDAIDYFNVNAGGTTMEGGLTIYASGNSDAEGPYYPGYYSGAMAVAGTNHHDQKAAYSNYGDYIEISAPGGETTQNLNQGVLSTSINGYIYMQGTSMACPHVSGVAALMISKAPGEFTAGMIRDMLISSSDDHYDVNEGYEGKLGAGRLNAFQAMKLVEEMMTGVANPLAFSGETHHNYRNILTWDGNPGGDPVVIAANSREKFGRPSGQANTEDTIPEGGTIIYKGHGPHFIHDFADNMDETHYRIWSWDTETNTASYGRQIHVSPGENIRFVPFDENFDNPVMPSGWNTQIVNEGGEDSGKLPVISITAEGDNPSVNPQDGSHMVKFNSEEARLHASKRLVSPAISSQNLPFVAIYFDWHFDDGNPQVNDRVRVQVSTNMSTWTTVSTINRHGTPSGWTEKELFLPSNYYDQEKIYLGFLFESDQGEENTGGNMYLDNIRVKTDPELIIPAFDVSTDEASQGEMLVVHNQTTGEQASTFSWSFGEDAYPQDATGEGPHRIRYYETGSKDITLIINDSIEVAINNVVNITQNTLEQPQGFEAETSDEGHIMLTWESPFTGKRDNNGENTVGGYNLYRNGKIMHTFPADTILSFTDKNVPEGWLSYELTAYHSTPWEESLPAGPLKTAINKIYVTLETPEGGNISPEPGTYTCLEEDTLNLEATPDEMYIFSYWLVNEEELENNPLELVLEGDSYIKAVFESTVNMPDLNSEQEMIVFPNPADDVLYVDIPESEGSVRVRFMDINGRVLIDKQIDNPVEQRAFNVSNLEEGVYLLQVHSDETSRVSKLIIRR